VNAVTLFGGTLLHHAAMNGLKEMLRLLVCVCVCVCVRTRAREVAEGRLQVTCPRRIEREYLDVCWLRQQERVSFCNETLCIHAMLDQDGDLSLREDARAPPRQCGLTLTYRITYIYLILAVLRGLY
jgi:hypothetical protein